MRPSAFLRLLSAPGSDAPVRLIATELAGEEPYNGWLEDPSGRVIGRLNEFRIECVDFAPVTPTERERLAESGPLQALRPAKEFIDPFDPRIGWHGETFEIGGYLKGFDGFDPDAHASFTTIAPAIDLCLHQHDWSGIAWVKVDGVFFAEVDLFNRECSLQKRVRIENPERRAMTVTWGVTGSVHSEAQGRQLLLEGIDEYGSVRKTPIYRKLPSRNRGAPFSERFHELVAMLGPEALVLDIGGGKRQLDDPRYINLEYTAYEEPDILGDGTCLPFRSNSFDLVYTAAVLEHVRDPLAMGREIHRVLKPGGIVLAAAAFMQPVHSEGQHFFNLTPYGMELTFAQFEKRASWVDVGFAFTMDWFLNVLGVRGRLPDQRLAEFLAIATEIEAQIPPDRGTYAAAGVWFEGIKASA